MRFPLIAAEQQQTPQPREILYDYCWSLDLAACLPALISKDSASAQEGRGKPRTRSAAQYQTAVSETDALLRRYCGSGTVQAPAMETGKCLRVRPGSAPKLDPHLPFTW